MQRNVEAETPRGSSKLSPDLDLLDPRVRLRTILPSLSENSLLFISHLLDFDKDPELFSRDEMTDILDGVVDLVENMPDRFKKKIEERQSAKRVDMMEILEPFNDKEKLAIVKNLSGIQMTDGCTVGCPWCAFEAKKTLEKAFTFESFEEFMQGYGEFLPSKSITLYYDSDPFDWYSEDGRLDYTDLARTFLDNTTKTRLYTSTAIPEGSELSIVRFLSFFYSEVLDKAGEGKNPRLELRFSQTQNNKKRIEKILDIAIKLGLSEEFIKQSITIVEREGEGEDLEDDGFINDPVKNVGYFVGHPERDASGRDKFGIGCTDSLHISPYYIKNLRGRKISQGGIRSESLEIATRRSPRGERTGALKPGLLEIPMLVHNEGYSWPLGSIKAKSFFSMWPKHTYHVFKDGVHQDTRVIESVRRDALSFAVALINLQLLSDIFLDEEEKEDFRNNPKEARIILRNLRKKFIPQYEERRESCLSLFDQDTDEEAKKIALDQINKIQNWLDNIDTNLGLKDLCL